LGIGMVTSVAGSPKGIRAKWKIAELLDISIPSVDLFKSQL
jgi:dimethylamine--corrinoid protein Co-methyltransferase